jgi:hypothetical protein
MSRLTALSKPGSLFNGDFQVTKFHDPTSEDANKHIAYNVIGKRASYTLWRNNHDPKHLFVMGDPIAAARKIRGYEWFYDAPCGRVIPLK